MGKVYLIATLLICVLHVTKHVEGSLEKSTRKSVLFMFGDSSIDVGNNNYIETIPENKADYKPYGNNGFFQQPTGRFSDGRVLIDYFAEYAKLPLIPPFLQPSADYSNGVNFASAGAGVLPETNQGLVIDLPKQLVNFEEVVKTLKEKLGEEEASDIVKEAVYFISIGSNDYMGGYLGSPRIQEARFPEEHVALVIGNLTTFVQELYDKGARKFGFLSLCPLGCFPVMRAFNPKANGDCLEAASNLALAHNSALNAVLLSVAHILNGFKYSNANFYDWLLDIMAHPSKYGFEEGVNACCGTGPFGGIHTCGGTKKVKEFDLCENPDHYVWFDSFHPTERIHELFAKEMWNGPKSSVAPYNLEELFFNEGKRIIADVVDAPEENIFSY